MGKKPKDYETSYENADKEFHRLICGYLYYKGFRKTAKKFRKESSLEGVDSVPNDLLLKIWNGKKTLEIEEVAIFQETDVVSETKAMADLRHKKRKIDELIKDIEPSQNSALKTSSDIVETTLQNGIEKKARKQENNKHTKKVFQRVDPEQVDFIHPSLQDNSYRAPDDDYGSRANRDLSVTRGKGFRTEKGKKKKGSYRGGKINLGVSSFKFTD